MKQIMKNKFNYIVASILLVFCAFSPGLSVYAQDSTVGFNKKVTGPNENGVYTINLEAYVTGSITVTTETKPADIILVLDYSQSMENNMAGSSTNTPQLKRINILRNAVAGFVNTVKESNANMLADGGGDNLGGHRIAFVLFHQSIVTGTGRNTFLNVENLTTTLASGSGNSYQQATVNYQNNNIIGANTQIYTRSGDAMERAETIFSNVSTSSNNYANNPNRTRVVVFFTDGAPGDSNNETNWQNNRGQLAEANQCIAAANRIKSSTSFGATIYSVGLFQKAEGTADATTTYLRYVSSDTTGQTEMPSTSNYVPVSNDKSIVVGEAGALANVFSSIANTAGGDYSASSSSSLLIDIVSASFQIPTDTDLGTVTVYKVPCTQASQTSIISFDSNRDHWTDITTNLVDPTDPTKPGLQKDVETGEVTVTGFDYGAEWCGWDASANDNTGAPHGHKLVLEIPITIKDDIIGGPVVETNAPGSQLIIRDSEGNQVGEPYVFTSPTVKIPVTIIIQKEGLISKTATPNDPSAQGHEDSAVFTLRRTKFVGSYQTHHYGER